MQINERVLIEPHIHKVEIRTDSDNWNEIADRIKNGEPPESAIKDLHTNFYLVFV